MSRKKTPVAPAVAGDDPRPLSTPALAMLHRVTAKACDTVDATFKALSEDHSSFAVGREFKAKLKSYAYELESAVVLGDLEAFHDELATAAQFVVAASVAAKERKKIMTHDLQEAIDRLQIVLDGEGQQ